MPDYDLIIVGGGPAAYSAALTARARDLKTVIIMSGQGGWLSRAERIDNYPGLPQTSGQALLDTFRTQAEAAGAELRTGVVRQLQPMKRQIMALVGSDIITAKAVVLAMGAAKPKLLPGEEELLGRGVSWCGTCDGMFFRGKDVAVISYWHGGVEEGVFLSSLASKVDYYAMMPHDLPAEPPFAVQQGKPTALTAADSKVLVSVGGENIAYDGVFVFRPAVAPDQMLPGLKTEGAFIAVDRTQRTSVPMIYAAGDCTGQPLQIAKAVGEGCVAAISAAEDIAAKEKQ